MSRCSFYKEIKLSVVRLIVKEDLSIKEDNKDFNVHANILYHWIKGYVKYGGRAFPCKGSALFS